MLKELKQKLIRVNVKFYQIQTQGQKVHWIAISNPLKNVHAKINTNDFNKKKALRPRRPVKHIHICIIQIKCFSLHK